MTVMLFYVTGTGHVLLYLGGIIGLTVMMDGF
jgi:hypothetical protein